MKNTTYHPRVQHSLPFYHSVLLALIEGLTLRMTDREIADHLNSRGLLSPSGRPWTQVAVRQCLFKLRNHQIVPSHLHKALLQLCFNGLLRPSQTEILFQPRRVM